MERFDDLELRFAYELHQQIYLLHVACGTKYVFFLR